MDCNDVCDKPSKPFESHHRCQKCRHELPPSLADLHDDVYDFGITRLLQFLGTVVRVVSLQSRVRKNLLHQSMLDLS
jgi:hypothetical protein